MNATLTGDEIRRLPPAITVVQAAALPGIGRSDAYHAVRTEIWSTRVVRVGAAARTTCPGTPMQRQLPRDEEHVDLGRPATR